MRAHFSIRVPWVLIWWAGDAVELHREHTCFYSWRCQGKCKKADLEDFRARGFVLFSSMTWRLVLTKVVFCCCSGGYRPSAQNQGRSCKTEDCIGSWSPRQADTDRQTVWFDEGGGWAIKRQGSWHQGQNQWSCTCANTCTSTCSICFTPRQIRAKSRRWSDKNEKGGRENREAGHCKCEAPKTAVSTELLHVEGDSRSAFTLNSCLNAFLKEDLTTLLMECVV